ncbi:MAG: tetratricopeptide repeat protein [Tepidisphaeraceae bacterium]
MPISRTTRQQLILAVTVVLISLFHAKFRVVERTPGDDTWDEVSRDGVRAMNDQRYDQAEALFQRALAISRAESSWRRATSLQNLGKVRFLRGEFAEAKPLFREAITMLESHHPDPAHLAVVLNDLAMTHANQGAFDEALPTIERAVRLDDRSDAAPREVIRRLRNYSAVLLANGRPADASAAAARATAMESANPVTAGRPTSKQSPK